MNSKFVNEKGVVIPPRITFLADSFDKLSIKRHVETWAIEISAADAAFFIKSFAGVALNWARLKRILQHPHDTQKRIIVLNPEKVFSEDINALPNDLSSILLDKKLSLIPHSFDVTYEYWNADEILHALFGDDSLYSTAFETIGHIAHLNLRNEMLPHKKIIGEIIFDKNPAIRTVVNKVGSIDTKFRTFEMELLAGEPDFMCTVRENECRFTFDFRHVYWNSRLNTEHTKMIKSFKKTDVIFDVFAGVGPFALPAAKKGCQVLANDLNPHSFIYLNQNKENNKIGDNMKTYNMDGREFIRLLGDQERVDHVLMNLPASAIEFLDSFISVYNVAKSCPMIHCYCFTSNLDDPNNDILQRARNSLNYHDKLEELSIAFVRSVAPGKEMYRLSFRLPLSVAQTRFAYTFST